MSWRATCPGCASGHHERHVRDWNITPGLIGGAWCDCPGEPTCTDQFKEFAERLHETLRQFESKWRDVDAESLRSLSWASGQETP